MNDLHPETAPPIETGHRAAKHAGSRAAATARHAARREQGAEVAAAAGRRLVFGTPAPAPPPAAHGQLAALEGAVDKLKAKMKRIIDFFETVDKDPFWDDTRNSWTSAFYAHRESTALTINYYHACCSEAVGTEKKEAAVRQLVVATEIIQGLINTLETSAELSMFRP